MDELCIALSAYPDCTQPEILRAAAEAGFDGCGLNRGLKQTPEQWELDVKTQRELELELVYVHCPFKNVDALWREDEDAAGEYLSMALDCLRRTAEAGAPIMVQHVWIGMENDISAGQAGVDRFGVLVREAEKLGVQVAFENTEGEPYLDRLMEAFRGERHVGFCWDSGHQKCYNHDRHLLKEYGDRLLCTHLNDNLGFWGDENGRITFLDDLHLLPFDGNADWTAVAEDLNVCGYGGPMTFELLTKSKTGRNENDGYGQMGLRAYMALALDRARKVAALRK